MANGFIRDKKESESTYAQESLFIDMNGLFRVVGIEPKEIMEKWIKYLDLFYRKELH